MYRVREMLANPIVLNSHFGAYTNFVNLLDMAAIAVPAGFRDNGTGSASASSLPPEPTGALLGMAERWLAGFRLTKPAYIIGPG